MVVDYLEKKILLLTVLTDGRAIIFVGVRNLKIKKSETDIENSVWEGRAYPQHAPRIVLVIPKASYANMAAIVMQRIP